MTAEPQSSTLDHSKSALRQYFSSSIMNRGNIRDSELMMNAMK
jgi:hypothetical protein